MPLREEKGIGQGTYVETNLSLLSLTSYTIVFACGQLARNEGETKVQTKTHLSGSTFQRVPEGNRISISSLLLRCDRPKGHERAKFDVDNLPSIKVPVLEGYPSSRAMLDFQLFRGMVWDLVDRRLILTSATTSLCES